MKRYTTDINNQNHSTITDDKATQLCVSELNDGIIKSIHKAYANITDEANTKNSINPLKSWHTPWWTSSLKLQRIGSRYGMTFGLPVINHVTAIYINYIYISMVANQKHVYPNLQLFRKRKKLIYSAMSRYIMLKLINYGNHIL